MENPGNELVQDQNLNIHSAGVASLGSKVDIPRAAKKVVLGKRKALNDISNSGMPFALQASKKPNSLNVAKEIGGPKNSLAFKKGKGKKALTAEKKTPSSIKEEGFLHNHQECITAHRKGMDFDYFLESVGLGSPLVLLQPLKSKEPESPVKKHLETEEIPIPVSPQNGKAQFPGYYQPVWESPAPKSMECFWKDEDFKLIDSPPPSPKL